MKQRCSTTPFDIVVEWRNHLSALVRRKPWLAGVLLRRRQRLLRRFAYFYRQLRLSPRRVRRKLGMTLGGTALLLALSGAPAQGAGITVDTTDPGLNPGDGLCSLIEAIDNANSDSDVSAGDCEAGSGADTIFLPPNSVITLTTTHNAAYGPTGLPVISSEIVIEGAGATIKGNAVSRLLAVAPSGDLTLNETTITGGTARPPLGGGGIFNRQGKVTINHSAVSDNGTGLRSDGGGVLNEGGIVIIDHSTLADNGAYYAGGAVFNDGGTVTISHSTISGNLGFRRGGGGVATKGGQVTIDHSAFTGNDAYDTGSSILNNGGTVTIDHSAFTDNSARLGGDIIINSGQLTMTYSTISGSQGFGSSGLVNDGTAILAHSVISGNSGYVGGAVFNSGQMTITNSDISNNSIRSEGNGGGIDNSGVATIIHSTIFNNSTRGGEGGGIANGGVMTITHSTIFSNSASTGYGGGVFNRGVATFVNSTISGNVGRRGAVYNSDTLTLFNSTISGNPAVGVVNEGGSLNLQRSLIAGNASPAVTGAEIQNTGAVNADDYNLFGHAGLSNAQAFANFIPGPTDVTAASDGSTPTPLDSILEIAPADNGGQTQTHALVSGSPAIDAAPNAACAAAPVAGLDQRDLPRNADGDLLGDSGLECDIGAFEFQPGRLAIAKEVSNDDQLIQDFPFQGPTGDFTLTSNTPADRQAFDLLPATHTFRETPPDQFALLGVTCVDDQDQDVTDTAVADFSAIEARADIILAENDDLTCTFLNEKTTFEADGEDRLYLPLIVK